MDKHGTINYIIIYLTLVNNGLPHLKYFHVLRKKNSTILCRQTELKYLFFNYRLERAVFRPRMFPLRLYLQLYDAKILNCKLMQPIYRI